VTPSAGAGGFIPPEATELDALFPKLEIVELIGRGGMGAVYKARQPDLDRHVAVKILPRERQGDPTFGERFLREAKTLAKLNHPNIIAVYDFGQVDDLFFFVMEFVDGVTLRDLIHSGKVTSDEALRIVPELCDALQFAHEEGVVHRDIKPENILLDKRGRVKIADFGLAKLVNNDDIDEASLTGTHQVMGTIRYMAPEQMRKSKDIDHRADLYSLGVVFYELLTGDLPMGRFAPPSKKVQIDVRLDEVVLRTLETEPDERFQNASEIRTALTEIFSASATATTAPVSIAGVGSAPPTSTGSTSSHSVRLHKLLDETDTRNRILHHVTFLISFFLFIAGVWMANLDGAVSFGVAALAVASAVMAWSVSVKRRMVWETIYKGHTIRMDGGGMLAERIYLDEGLVQTGGFGVKMEFRTKIKAGDGIGDEIIIWFDAALAFARCRIDVEEQIPM
jgi:serine/threonine protein kinase